MEIWDQECEQTKPNPNDKDTKTETPVLDVFFTWREKFCILYHEKKKSQKKTQLIECVCLSELINVSNAKKSIESEWKCRTEERKNNNLNVFHDFFSFNLCCFVCPSKKTSRKERKTNDDRHKLLT